MNSDSNVKEKVLAFLRSKGEIPGQTEEEQLAFEYIDNKLIDSLGIVIMVLTFEEEFGIFFEPEDMQSMEFRTIGGLISLIERLIKEKTHA
jgi:acyl carrier protein